MSHSKSNVRMPWNLGDMGGPFVTPFHPLIQPHHTFLSPHSLHELVSHVRLSCRLCILAASVLGEANERAELSSEPRFPSPLNFFLLLPSILPHHTFPCKRILVIAMRLINIYTFRLEQFFGNKLPLYAILSHCWEDEELSFEEWQAIETNNGEIVERIQRKEGYQKIVDACRYTRAVSKVWGGPLDRRLKYLWVDTVCIDKRSSAELSEAINSMFKWYSGSTTCLVYMVDVNLASSRADNRPSRRQVSENDALSETTRRQFRESKWFTRGWTLQELLAPSDIIYLSKRWEAIGTNFDLIANVSDASKIPPDVLKKERGLRNLTVAEKMSWASRRITTRPEDIAYCLMGIFGVNMPLLYGEGSNAFRRLQLEIIKNTHDHSIFLWEDLGRSSALAPSPEFFRDISLCHKRSWLHGRDPYHNSNLGLRVNFPLLPTIDSGISLAVLDCVPIGPKLSNSLYYCLIVSTPSRHFGEPQDEAKVLGHMVVDTWAFGFEDHGVLRKALYLDLSIPMFGSERRTNLTAASKGKPFMLAYAWHGDPCIITQVIFREDSDFRDLDADANINHLSTLELGLGGRIVTKERQELPVLKIDRTSQISGMKLLLFKIFNQKQKRGLWFFVVHHRDYGWTVPWFSGSPPKQGFRDEVMNNLPLFAPPKSSVEGLYGCFLKTQVLSWPGFSCNPTQVTCALITVNFNWIERELDKASKSSKPSKFSTPSGSYDTSESFESSESSDSSDY